jgi:hypothetical protein
MPLNVQPVHRNRSCRPMMTGFGTNSIAIALKKNLSFSYRKLHQWNSTVVVRASAVDDDRNKTIHSFGKTDRIIWCRLRCHRRMSIKTYLLDDEMFTKLTRMSLEIISKQPSTAIQSVDEQLKTFDLHGFKQSSATVTGSKTDTDFR